MLSMPRQCVCRGGGEKNVENGKVREEKKNGAEAKSGGSSTTQSRPRRLGFVVTTSEKITKMRAGEKVFVEKPMPNPEGCFRGRGSPP